MRHLCFFGLLIYFLLIQSQDFDLDSFNQERLSTIPSFIIPASRDDRYRSVFWEWQVTCGSQEITCGHGSASWCCTKTKTCGYYKVCQEFHSLDLLMKIFIGSLLFIIIVGWCKGSCLCASDDELQNHETNNCSTIELLPTLTRPALALTLSSMTEQSSIGNTLLRSSAATVEQLPEYNHSNTRRETTISLEQPDLSSPPTYDDVIQRSTTTILLEQEPLTPPPTYDDSLREN